MQDVEVHTVGRIDREIYKCITEDIVTDEVIITDERLKHIQERHPEAYESTIEYVANIIQNPDYIISDEKHDNTGLVFRRNADAKKQLMLVFRVCVSVDVKGYKNSIISSWVISENRLKNYLKNKKILYKRE